MLALVACGRQFEGDDPAVVSGATPQAKGGRIPVENIWTWDRPFMGNGVRISSTAALAALEPTFPVYVPKTSDPMQIFGPPGPDGTAGNYAFFFVLDDPTDGTVWVAESAPDLNGSAADRLASYKDIVSENGQPDIHSTAEIVTIRGGTPALLGTMNGLSSLEWVVGGTQVHLMGPTLTRSQVLDVANSI